MVCIMVAVVGDLFCWCFWQRAQIVPGVSVDSAVWVSVFLGKRSILPLLIAATAAVVVLVVVIVAFDESSLWVRRGCDCDDSLETRARPADDCCSVCF